MRYRGIRAARKQPTGHRPHLQKNAGAELMRHLNTLDKRTGWRMCRRQ